MKKRFKLFLFILLMLILPIGVQAGGSDDDKTVKCKYSILECVSEKGYLHKANPDYSMSPDCYFIVQQKNDWIELYDYKSGYSPKGGKEDLQNWDNNYCPNTIRIHEGFNNTLWYGYKNLDSARKSSKDYDYIYVLDTYLKELKSTADKFDSVVDYVCEYDNFSIGYNKEGYPIVANAKPLISPILGTFSYSLSNVMRETKADVPGKCQPVHFCLTNDSVGSYVNNSYLIFPNKTEFEKHKGDCQESGIFDAEYDTSNDPGEIEVGDTEVDVGNCDTLPIGIINYLVDALKLIRWICLVLVVIFGVLDFVKATAADDQDALKKAWQSFIKRLIVLIVLFLIPLLVEFVLEIAGLYKGCDWNIS